MSKMAVFVAMFCLVYRTMAFAQEPLPSKISPEWIEAEVAKHGAEDVVERLWNADRFIEITNQVAQGKDRWIAIAPIIRGGTDAGAAEILMDSMALALPKNPNAVLRAFALMHGSPDNISKLCVSPFVEGTKEQDLSYIRRAIVALRRINTPALVKLRDSCVLSLQESRRRVNRDGE